MKVKRKAEIMKKLLNLNNEKEKSNLCTKRKKLKLRRELIKFAISSPIYIQHFCCSFYKYDKILLKNFLLKVNNDEQLRNYLNHNEIIWRYKFLESEWGYETDLIFNLDKIYRENAINLSKCTGYYCLEILYKVINYINDNFPIIVKEKLTKEEKNLIIFLLFKGDLKDYMYKHNVSKVFINSLIKKNLRKL